EVGEIEKRKTEEVLKELNEISASLLALDKIKEWKRKKEERETLRKSIPEEVLTLFPDLPSVYQYITKRDQVDKSVHDYAALDLPYTLESKDKEVSRLQSLISDSEKRAHLLEKRE